MFVGNYCESTKHIVETLPFWIILLFEFIFGITSTIFNFILFIVIVKNSTFHLNLRILLCQMSFFIMWYSTGYLCKTVYLSVNMMNNPCDLVTDAFHCKLQEIWTTALPSIATHYSLLVIGLERFYATLKFRVYEHNRNILPVLVLSAALWSLVICQQVLPLVAMVKSAKTMPMCVNLLSLNSQSAVTVVSLSFINEALSITVHLINLRLNNFNLKTVYINQAQENLSARFQLDQNFKTIRTILPIVVVHILCWLPKSGCFIAMIYLYLFPSFTQQICIMHLINLTTIIFGNVYTIITFARNPTIRRDAQKLSPFVYKFIQFVSCKNRMKMFKVKVDINDFTETQKHFQMLNMMWGKKITPPPESNYYV